MLERNYHWYDVAGFIRRPYDGALGLIDLCFANGGGHLRRHADQWHIDQAFQRDG